MKNSSAPAFSKYIWLPPAPFRNEFILSFLMNIQNPRISVCWRMCLAPLSFSSSTCISIGLTWLIWGPHRSQGSTTYSGGRGREACSSGHPQMQRCPRYPRMDLQAELWAESCPLPVCQNTSQKGHKCFRNITWTSTSLEDWAYLLLIVVTFFWIEQWSIIDPQKLLATLIFFLQVLIIHTNSFKEKGWEKEMATHSSILAWKSPWTEEPGRLQSMGLHDWTCVHEGGGRWVASNKLAEIKINK